MKWLLLFTCLPVWSAPIPGTSSSLLVSAKPNIFRSNRGFSMNSGQTDWSLGVAPTEIPSMVTIYKSPEIHRGTQPVLTVRVDDLTKKNASLKSYVKQWMKDYRLLGFDVLQVKPFKVNVETAYVIDVNESKGDKKLRQVVFLKDQTAVILTCRDRKEYFEETVKSCNEIVRSFEWNSSESFPSRTGV